MMAVLDKIEMKVKAEPDLYKLVQNIIEAGHWFLLGQRAQANNMDEQVLEASDHLWRLARDLDTEEDDNDKKAETI